MNKVAHPREPIQLVPAVQITVVSFMYQINHFVSRFDNTDELTSYSSSVTEIVRGSLSESYHRVYAQNMDPFRKAI